MFFMEILKLSRCMAMADLCKVQTKTEEKWCPSYLILGKSVQLYSELSISRALILHNFIKGCNIAIH